MKRPVPLPVDPSRIPPPLASLHQWVSWKYKWDPKLKNWKKPPIDPRTGWFAKPNDPSTCGTLQEALKRMTRDNLDGIGFLLTENDPFVGIDLDDGVTSEGIAPWAQEILDVFETYAEVSVSGTGIHLILKYSRQFGKGVRTPHIEVYGNRRFLVVTGQTLPNRANITDCTELFATWFERFKAESSKAESSLAPANRPGTCRAVAPTADLTEADHHVLATCRAMDSKFARLFNTGDLADYSNDHSRADLALLGYFVKAGTDTPEDLDRLFRHSALMREKWERKDYRERSIARALNGAVIAGVSTLDTEANLRRELEAKLQHIRNLTELLRRNSEMLEWIAQIMRNSKLKLAAPVAYALLREFASFEDCGATKPYPIVMDRIAEETGMHRNTVSRHIKRLEADGLFMTKRVIERGYTDDATGELVSPKTRMYIAPKGTAQDFAAGVAAFDGESAWGGQRAAKQNATLKAKRPNLTVLENEDPEPGHKFSVIAPTDEAQPA